jgi:transcriptional regulator GlxA family with amidase domain
VASDRVTDINRRTFVAGSLAAGIALPASGLGVAKALSDGDSEALPDRPLPMPREGVIRAAFLIGPGVNVIDTAGPWEVFQDAAVMAGGSPPFEQYTVAETIDPVEASAGLTIVPDYPLAAVPSPNVVVVPAQQSSSATIGWLRRAARRTDVVMSVCTGAYVLAEAGLLDGRTATTHHGSFDHFEASFPKIELIRGPRFVEHDDIATAGGLTSGIDLALRVVERYLGRPAAAGTARYMEHESTRWRSA